MATSSNAALKIPGASEKGGAAASDIISVPDACKYLGVHRNTLYKLIQGGELPAFRMITGGRWKFRKKELEQWLEDKQSRARL